jgi:hypothetical protein
MSIHSLHQYQNEVEKIIHLEMHFSILVVDKL